MPHYFSARMVTQTCVPALAGLSQLDHKEYSPMEQSRASRSQLVQWQGSCFPPGLGTRSLNCMMYV